MNTQHSEALYRKACSLIPGGVSSPVRAFKGVGGTPRFIERGEGSRVFDVDGNAYIDYVQSWGPLILGHAHPNVVEAIQITASKGTSFGAPTELEVMLADSLKGLLSSIDLIRFVNSGTEATMSALRLARAHTKRNKIIKFAGGYHGHADLLLAEAGSGVATLALPDSAGVPDSATADTLVVPYNDLLAVEESFERFPDEIAAVIVEPIAGNMGFVVPSPEFLPGIQFLCERYGAVFILDEVMTGFRAAKLGAQTLWGLNPDITCLGKVIGGGLPVAAYGGKEEIMQNVAPLGSMYQAGTLSGNPLGMAAGLATLEVLLTPGTFESIATKCERLLLGIRELARRHSIRIQAAHVGTMFGFYFLKPETPERDTPITNYALAKKYVDTPRYAKFFHAMLEQGCYFAPSAYEAGFMSLAHSEEDLSHTLDAIEKAFSRLDH